MPGQFHILRLFILRWRARERNCFGKLRAAAAGVCISRVNPSIDTFFPPASEFLLLIYELTAKKPVLFLLTHVRSVLRETDFAAEK
jgi:hypothetical protein